MSNIHSNMHCGIKGEYKIIQNRNGEITETGWFDNLVLNQGLNALGTAGSSIFAYCKLGTGVSTPNENQTALDAQIVSSNSINSSASQATNLGAPTYGCQYTFAYGFAQGAVVGNISEIGVGYGSAAGNLFSRALITDSYGNPIAISVIAIDQLTIYYRVTIYPNLTESYGSFTINGISYNYVSKLCAANSFGQSTGTFTNNWLYPVAMTFYNESPTKPTIAAITAAGPNGVAGSSWSYNTPFGSSGNYGYTNNSYYIDSVWNFGIQLANCTGGIGAIKATWAFSGVFNYQIVFDNPLPKTGNQTMSLTTRISWGRI
jgi:hypothetical protein